MSACKSSKCLGQATSPSPSYVICDKWSQNSLSMWKICQLDRHFRGWTITNSVIDVWRFNTDCEDLTFHLALLLAPKMLTVLDLPTFRGSPWYEVPTRPHTVWCGSPIRYDGLVAIILRIFLNSWLSAQESGLISLQEVRFACLVIVIVTCVNRSFTVKGEDESDSQFSWEKSQLC